MVKYNLSKEAYFNLICLKERAGRFAVHLWVKKMLQTLFKNSLWGLADGTSSADCLQFLELFLSYWNFTAWEFLLPSTSLENSGAWMIINNGYIFSHYQKSETY